MSAITFVAQRAQADASADFKEVYDVIRQHLPGATDAELNRAAVQGLVAKLSPRVALVSPGAETAPSAADPLVTRAAGFDGVIAYIRIRRVAQGLPEGVFESCRAVALTNKVKGVVVDLRYADGEDYAAAAATADRFVTKEQPLIDWGGGMLRSSSKEKSAAINVPVAVLVNQETKAAAEALAAILRETGAGLLLGGKTAGQALMYKEYPLASGEKLRVGTEGVRLGNGTSLGELKPDILVDVNLQDERAYYADAFKAVPARSATSASSGKAGQLGPNQAVRRTRFNEAELVRERREGPAVDPDAPRKEDPEAPLVYDPALARAIDVLKGLAVVRQSEAIFR
jgi:hypothetical protein